MKRVLSFVLSVITVVMLLPIYASSAEYSTAYAPFASVAPAVDGKKDDCYGQSFAVGSESDPVHGTAYFCHNGSYLYVYVDVTDPTAAPLKADKKEVVGGNGGYGFADLRCNDGVTVGINLGSGSDNNMTVDRITGTAPAYTGMYCAERQTNSDFGKYYAGRHAFAPVGGEWSDDNGNAMNLYFYRFTTKETENGYCAEMRIPFGRNADGTAHDAKALSETGFSILVQLSDSNIDNSTASGSKAPLASFVSSNPSVTAGLAVWGSILSNYEKGWDKIEIEEPGEIVSVDPPVEPPVEEKIELPGTVEKELHFDKETGFVSGEDFELAGNQKQGSVKLSDKYDHTGNGGQSLEISSRNVATNRVKLLDVFPPDFRGRAFRVSAWVYVPHTDAEIRISSYSPGSYGIEYSSVMCKKDTWTQISFIHKHTDDDVTQLGIDQLPGKKVAPVIYVDDIVITDISESVEMPELDIQLIMDGDIIKFKSGKTDLIDDCVVVPLQKMSEKLHCAWEIKGSKITLTRGSDKIELSTGSKKAIVNGESVTLDVSVQNLNDVLVVPLQFLAETLDCTYEWDSVKRIVKIETTAKNEINIYRDYTKQEIYGFGFSVHQSSEALRSGTTPEMQKEILDALFGNTGKGAAFTLLRFSIRSGLIEDSEKISAGGTIAPVEGVWDFETYDSQRWVADQALKYDPNVTFIASPWSPPAWMKVNGSVNGKTETPNKLAKEYYDDYANYLAVWTDKYVNEYGYNVKYLSVQNEPYLDTSYGSCLFSSSELAQIADLTADKLREMGLDEVLVGASEGAYVAESYGIMQTVKDSKVGFIPTHSYASLDAASLERSDLAEYGLPIIQTEYNLGPGYRKQYIIKEGITVAKQIADCLNGGFNGYLYWYGQRQITTSKPGNAESLIDYNDNKILYGKEFYVMAQFSRFFRPGDYIVLSYSGNKDVYVVSSINETTGKVSTILINDTNDPVTVDINGLVGILDVYVTNNSKNFDKLESVDSSELDSYELTARSITLLTENLSDEEGGMPPETSGAETTSLDTDDDQNEPSAATDGGAPVAVIVIVAAVAIAAIVIVIIATKKKS